MTGTEKGTAGPDNIKGVAAMSETLGSTTRQQGKVCQALNELERREDGELPQLQVTLSAREGEAIVSMHVDKRRTSRRKTSTTSLLRSHRAQVVPFAWTGKSPQPNEDSRFCLHHYWPEKAGGIVVESLTATGGSPQAFRALLKAEIEMGLLPNLMYDYDATGELREFDVEMLETPSGRVTSES